MNLTKILEEFYRVEEMVLGPFPEIMEIYNQGFHLPQEEFIEFLVTIHGAIHFQVFKYLTRTKGIEKAKEIVTDLNEFIIKKLESRKLSLKTEDTTEAKLAFL